MSDYDIVTRAAKVIHNHACICDGLALGCSGDIAEALASAGLLATEGQPHPGAISE